MPTSIKPEDNFIPTVLDLKQNYPNPFNRGTKIVFDLPKEDIVIISIYSIIGETITELFKNTLKPGRYSVNWDGKNYSSGIYFYSIQTSENRIVKK